MAICHFCKKFMSKPRIWQPYVLFEINNSFTTNYCTAVMQLDFLQGEDILFLPIAKVCSKLNFPPAPEAERNRQCGPAGWSAEAVFWQSLLLRLVVRIGHVFWQRQKVCQLCTPNYVGHRVYCSPVCGWSSTDAFSWGYQLCAELVPSRARRPYPPLWRSI